MKRTAFLFITIFSFVLVPCLTAQSDSEKTMKEIKTALGTFPSFMEAVPDAMLSNSWAHFTNYALPETVIPPKYMELIKLAVAAQIPCQYCVYAHTVNAKASGATDQEVKEAVMHSAWVRHWSTVVNGAGLDFEEFKKEYDEIMQHIAEQSK